MRNIACRATVVALLCSLTACAGRGEYAPAGGSAPVPSLWPIGQSAHVVSSGYGTRGRQGGKNSRFHKGIDLPAPRGTAVVAAAAGTVSLVANQGAYGRYVVIDHGNGYQTLYAHLLEFQTRPGARVAAGQRIGSVGKSGNATGYHLHYEVHRRGQTVDPMAYLPR